MILRLLSHGLWLLSHRATVQSIPVGWSARGSDLALAKERVTAALTLIAKLSPRWLERHRPYVTRIQVLPIVRTAAQWQTATRQVELDHDYVCATGRTAAEIGSSIVHEYTHARVEAAGIRYNADSRVRIERVCIRQQLAFVGLLPASDERTDFETRLKVTLERAPAIWSARTDEEEWQKAMPLLGVPPWLIRAGLWARRWRASRGRTA